jgi:crotonobetainyl-CoA:carnitine CoA-transferase CaiB-like acyl-CoA transferase
MQRMIASDTQEITITGGNRSAQYAETWLQLLGHARAQHPREAAVHITGNENVTTDSILGTTIRTWDYQVGMPGNGVLASASSGAATVIGKADGPAVPLPADMPEKWCGAFAAILALAESWRKRGMPDAPSVHYDVSSVDILRSFCLQNSGGPAEMAHSWRRNGRLCIEHGGIFPMGFYRCKDGHVAILGRSRRDWRQIRQAMGDPAWAQSEAFADPFVIARNGEQADALLEQTLQTFTRDELLARGLEYGAVIAPVFNQAEAAARQIFRQSFIIDGQPQMPFIAQANTAAPTTSRARPAARFWADAPLAGMRVIELAWVWSGPMVGQILADLGAEVIKVEAPERFDLYRTRGLEAMRGKMDETARTESSLYFHSLNRNKIGLSLDLKQPTDLQTLKDLAAQSDLLIENFTVGTMERLGLGADVLAAINPALVQLSMSGPGKGSSVEKLRSYGLVLSALAGAEALIEHEGEFLGSPTFSLSDPNAATFGTLAALAAVLEAGKTGQGSAMDLSQIEAAATLAGTATIAPPEGKIVQDAQGRFIAYAQGLEAAVLQLEDTDASPVFADCSGWLASTHPYTGDEPLVAAPWRVNGQRPHLRKLAPLLGEGNDYVHRHVLGRAEP